MSKLYIGAHRTSSVTHRRLATATGNVTWSKDHGAQVNCIAVDPPVNPNRVKIEALISGATAAGLTVALKIFEKLYLVTIQVAQSIGQEAATLRATVERLKILSYPEVTTSAASGVGETDATINGVIDSLGEFAAVKVFFEWRQGSSGEWTETTKQDKTATGSFNQALSGLSAGTYYEFKAIIEYTAGGDTYQVVGGTLDFTTTYGDGPPPFW